MHYLDALDCNVMSKESLERLHRKPGRPPRMKSSADIRVTIRLTKAEHAAWLKRAGGLSLGEWIRKQCEGRKP